MIPVVSGSVMILYVPPSVKRYAKPNAYVSTQIPTPVSVHNAEPGVLRINASLTPVLYVIPFAIPRVSLVIPISVKRQTVLGNVNQTPVVRSQSVTKQSKSPANTLDVN